MSNIFNFDELPDDNEQVFLKNLRKKLAPPEGASKELTKLRTDLLESVEVALSKPGKATTRDIFQALQRVADDRVARMEELVRENDEAKTVAFTAAEAAKKKIAAMDPLKVKPGKKKFAVAGAVDAQNEIRATIDALNATIGQDEADAIHVLARDAKLQDDDASITFDFKGAITTEIDLEADTVSVKGGGSAKGGHIGTKPIAGQGKLNPAHKMPASVAAKGPYVQFITRSHGRVTLSNGEVKSTYDTVDQLAEAVVKKVTANGKTYQLPDFPITDPKTKQTTIFKGQTLEPGNDEQNKADVMLWIQNRNELTKGKYKLCDVTKYDNPLIYVGHALALPPGSENIAPRQSGTYCQLCLFNTTPVGKDYQAGKAAKVSPIVGGIYLPPEKENVYFAEQSVPSSNGKYSIPGSLDNAREILARSGLDPEYSYKHYILTDITARIPVVGAKNSGEGKASAEIETPKRNEGAIRHVPNGQNWVERELGGDRGRVKFSGYTHEIMDNGTLVRNDKRVAEAAYGGSNYAFSLFGLRIPVGDMAGLPVGFSWSKPSSQTSLASNALRSGGSLVNVTLSTLGAHGFNTMFTDEQAKNTQHLDSAGNVVSYMNLLNAKKHFLDETAAFDNATTKEGKQEAAQKTLVAWRDLTENQLMLQIDSDRVPRAGIEAALRQRMALDGVDVAKIDKTLYDEKVNPRLQVVDMSQEQLESQRAYVKKGKNLKFETFVPGQTNAAYNSNFAVNSSWRSMNIFEKEISKGKEKEISESDAMGLSEKTWGKIVGQKDQPANKEGIAATSVLIRTNLSAQITASELLHDVYYNPQNYFTADEIGKGLHEKMIEKLLPVPKGAKGVKDAEVLPEGTDDAKNKAFANKDVTRRGSTAFITYFFPDGRQPNSRPDIVGPAFADGIDANPELFKDLMLRATDQQKGRDKDGNTDARRFGTGLLYAFGSEKVSLQRDPVTHQVIHGIVPPAYQGLVHALGGEEKNPELQDSVRKITQRAEAGMKGVSPYALNNLDNSYRDVQDDHVTSSKEALGRVAQKIEVGQLLVRGLSGPSQRLLAQDAILLTLLKDPKAFDGVQKVLEAEGFSYSKDMRNVIKHVNKANAEYQKSGDIKDLQEATKEYGEFFRDMESHANKRSGGRKENAWDHFIAAVGKDEAMTNSVIGAIDSHEQMRAALLRKVPSIVSYMHTSRESDFAINPTKGRKIVGAAQDTSYDLGGKPYQSLFLSLPFDKEGNVTKKDVEISAQQTLNLTQALGKNFDEGTVLFGNDKGNHLQEKLGKMLDKRNKGKELSEKEKQLAEALSQIGGNTNLSNITLNNDQLAADTKDQGDAKKQNGKPKKEVNQFDKILQRNHISKQDLAMATESDWRPVVLLNADQAKLLQGKTGDELLNIESQFVLDALQKNAAKHKTVLPKIEGVSQLDIAKEVLKQNLIQVVGSPNDLLVPSNDAINKLLTASTSVNQNTLQGNTLNTNPFLALTKDEKLQLANATNPRDLLLAKADILLTRAQHENPNLTLAPYTLQNVALAAVQKNHITLDLTKADLLDIKASQGLQTSLDQNDNHAKGIPLWIAAAFAKLPGSKTPGVPGKCLTCDVIPMIPNVPPINGTGVVR